MAVRVISNGDPLDDFKKRHPEYEDKINYSLKKWDSPSAVPSLKKTDTTSTSTSTTEHPSVTSSAVREANVTEPPIKHSIEAYTPSKSANSEKYDKWLNNDYKMSKDEEKEAKQIVKDFYDAHKGINSTNPKIVERTRLAMTPEEQEEYKNINALDNKVSNSAAFFGGAMNAVPFLRQAMDKAGEKLGAGEKSFTETVKNQQTQSPHAYNAGNAVSKIEQYMTLNGLLPEGSSLATRLGAGQLADTILDTIPKIVENAYDDKYTTEDGIDKMQIAQDFLDSQKENLFYNLIPEVAPYVPGMIKKIGGKAIDGAKNVGENIKEIKNVGNSIDNAFGKDFTTDTIRDSIGEEARAMKRNADSNNLTALMEDFNKNHFTNSLKDEAEALAKAEASNNLNILMEQFRQSNVDENSVKEVADAINNAVKNDGANVVDAVKNVTENVAPTPNVVRQTVEEVAENTKPIANEVADATKEQMKNPTLSQTREKLVERGLASEEVADKYMPKAEYYHDKYNLDAGAKRAIGRVEQIGTQAAIDEVKNGSQTVLSADEVNQLRFAYHKAMADNQPEVAAKALKTLTRSGSSYGLGLRVMQDFAKDSPEGALAYTLSQANIKVDNAKRAAGFSDAVSDMADALSDAIKGGKADEVKKVLNSSLGDYVPNARKGVKRRLANKQIDGQMVLWDYIEKEEAKGTPLTQISEEAAKMLKKKAGVVSLTPKQEKEMFEYFTKASEYKPQDYGYRINVAKAMDIVNKEMPSSLGDKVKTTLYDNMLGNIRTALTRNFGGNLIGNTLEKAQKPLKTSIDALTSLATGKRNYVLNADNATDYAEGFVKGIKEQASDMKNKVSTLRSGEKDMLDALNTATSAYKGSNKLSKGLNGYDRAVKGVMAFGDRPFYEAEYAGAKKELETIAKKYGNDALQTVGVSDDALASVESQIEYLARQRALEAVYQNKSLSAEAFTKMKKALSDIAIDTIGFDPLSHSTLPFTQVPANMFSRGIDYTPVGFIKNALNTAAEIKGGNFNQKRFVDATSRNLTGAGILAGATALANNGLITGALSDDPDKRKAQREAGELEYALNVGSKQRDISDLPVIGPMAQAGAAYADSQNEDNTTLENLVAGTSAATNAMLQNSMLQNLNRMLGTNTYSQDDDKLTDKVKNTVLSAGSQLVPSLVRQGSQTIDPYKRELGEYGTTEYYLNNVINATPARFMLDKKYDREGNEILNNNGRNIAARAFENMISPYTVSEPHYSPVTQEANRLFDLTGDNGVYVPEIRKSEIEKLKGFDAENYSYDLKLDINREYDTRVSEDAQKVIASDFYKNLSSEEQNKVLKDIYSMEKEISKLDLSRKGKTKEEIEQLEADKKIYTTDTTLTKEYQNGGIEAAIEYLKKKSDFDKVEVKSNDTTDRIYEEQGIEGLKRYKQKSDTFKELGLDMKDSKANELYDTFRKSDLEDYAKEKRIFDNRGLDYNEKSKEIYDSLGDKGLDALSVTKHVGSSAGSSYIPYLTSKGLNMTPEEAGKFLSQKASSTKIMQENPDNYEAIYYFYYTQANAKDKDKDNKLSKKEQEAYLDTLNIDDDMKNLIKQYLASREVK